MRLLTKKLATLLALVLAHRCSDIGRLSLKGRKYSLEGAVLKCTGLAKQARPGRQGSLRPVVVSPYPEDPLLCPVSCLRQYEKATSAIRGKEGQLQDCSKQFGSGTAILRSDNNHTHFCIFTSSSFHKCGTAMAVPAL